MPALYGAPHGKCRIQSGRKPWRLSLIQQNAQEGERIWVQHGMKHRLQIVCISVYLEKQTAENFIYQCFYRAGGFHRRRCGGNDNRSGIQGNGNLSDGTVHDYGHGGIR